MVAQHPTPLPVFLAGGIDEAAVPFELLIGAGIDYRDLRGTEPRDYPAFDEALFLVADPRIFERFVKERLPGTWCEMVNREPLSATSSAAARRSLT